MRSLAKLAVVDANIEPKPNQSLLHGLSRCFRQGQKRRLPRGHRGVVGRRREAAAFAPGAGGEAREKKGHKTGAKDQDTLAGVRFMVFSETVRATQILNASVLSKGRFDRAIFAARGKHVNLKVAPCFTLCARSPSS